MRRFKLSYSSVVSTLALFIALGGVSYAAIAIPDDSVGTDQIRDQGVAIADIRDGNVGTNEIRTNGVQGIDVRDGSLLCKDFAAQEPACETRGGGGVNLTARSQLVAYQNGECEREFDPGNPNFPDDFPPNYEIRCAYPAQTLVAECESGERATGGSAHDPGAQSARDPLPLQDRPNPETGTPTGWAVDALETFASADSQEGPPPEPPAPELRIFVVCAS